MNDLTYGKSRNWEEVRNNRFLLSSAFPCCGSAALRFYALDAGLAKDAILGSGLTCADVRYYLPRHEVGGNLNALRWEKLSNEGSNLIMSICPSIIKEIVPSICFVWVSTLYHKLISNHCMLTENVILHWKIAQHHIRPLERPT